jgi:deoxyribose-phosphate aldolase
VSNLASYIDHTNLKPSATAADIEKLCGEALEYQFRAVCVNGVWVRDCKRWLMGTQVAISAVCGFPLGAAASAAKAYEAELAADDGATEIDMVMQIGPFLEGRYAEVESDIRTIVGAVKGAAIVKVILETGYLSDQQIVDACKLAEQAGAHYVKTSTGFGPGGATVQHVKLMRSAVSDAVKVKASGGIRDYATALAMIEAGAERLGTSSGVAIVQGSTGGEAY